MFLCVCFIVSEISEMWKLVKTFNMNTNSPSACWCFHQLNCSRILSAVRASTRFSNLSPKSNKLPKYVHFASFLSPTGERRKDLIVNICFPFPSSLWSTAVPPGRHSSSSSTLPPSTASTHPPTHPSATRPAGCPAEAQWSQSVHMKTH